MKKLLLVGFTILGFSSLTNAQTDRCGTMQHHEYLQSIDPGYTERQAAIDELILNSIKNDPSFRITNTVTIPVVVHVLYSTNNATQNISTARIQAQIARLNADYSATNTDITSVPSVFQSVIGNPAIQFCLAQQDPNGVATDGIIRKQTTVTSWSTNDNIKRTANGGDDAWPNTKYLNLWIGNLGSGLLGYAQFPGGAAATEIGRAHV